MKKYKYARIILISIFIFALISIMPACVPSRPVETDIPEAQSTPTQSISPTLTVETPIPTETQKDLILINSSEADPFAVSQMQTTLGTLAQEQGIELAVMDQIPSEIPLNTMVIVIVGEGLDVNNFAQNNPGIVFVAVDNASAVPSANLTVIGNPIDNQQHQAFMAGYLSALISNDYKAAVLAPSDIEESELILESFVVGARYFCGLCLPKYPPYQSYPQSYTLPQDYSQDTSQPVLENLQSNGIEVLFVQGDLLTTSLLSEISEMGIKIISDVRPGIVQNNYGGTIVSDPAPALISIWQDLLEGKAGVEIPASIDIIDRESDLISEGRYQNFLEIAESLQAGLILPGSVP